MKRMIMKRTNLLLTLLILVSWVAQAKEYTLLSPDHRITMKIRVDKRVTFEVSRNGKVVISSPGIAITVDGVVIPVENAKVKKVLHTHVDEILHPVVPVKNAVIRNQYNEITLKFRGIYDIIFRLYNDGVAYRFAIHQPGSVEVEDETARFVFPEGTRVFYPREESFFSHNERSYIHLDLKDIQPGDMASLPALFEVPDGPDVLLTESDLNDYPGMWIMGTGKDEITATFPKYPEKTVQIKDRNVKPVKRADYLAKTLGERTFPWRVMIVAPEAKDLLENEMVYKLAPPLKLKDPSWIKPGLVAWDWWNALNVYGVDFKSGVNTETYKYFIDFASANGIPYIILDEGWYKPGNLPDINPDVNIEELVRYGKEKQVGVILWVVWKTLDDQMEKALDQFERWGIKGVKVDFMQRDDQWMVNFYRKVARETAKRHLLVDFHGAYKPSGLRREYPNVISREGVKGMEWNKWSKEITPVHNVTIPFIRMTAGPMDYTPGAMVNAHQKNFLVSFDRPMSMTTRVHQLAMYVVYESPLQMLADSPSNYLREPVCLEYLSHMPTTWDETHALAGEVGKFVVVARRKGNTWYIGAMNGNGKRTVHVDLSFLPQGTYQAEVFRDGMNADRYAQDYKKTEETIPSDRKLNIDMADGGGWVGILRKK
ncbi:MAG TPA: glycoside hydrolase family 97 protein [Bacteroidetes bacterium]|nr:glycoside hydrolase family 97 protein [Bacteroidota bacterium]